MAGHKSPHASLLRSSHEGNLVIEVPPGDTGDNHIHAGKNVYQGLLWPSHVDRDHTDAALLERPFRVRVSG